MTKLTLPFDVIRTDGRTQSRAQLSPDVIRDYTEAMLADAVFPPVDVYHDGSTYWLADGFHRIAAAREAGLKEFEAEVHQGTRRDALWHSLGANKDHGLRDSPADKRQKAEIALRDPGWNMMPQARIARHIGVSPEYLSRLKKELSIDRSIDRPVTVQRGGTTYTMNTANIGKVAPAPRYSPDPDLADPPSPDDVPAIQAEDDRAPVVTEDGVILRYKPADRARCLKCAEWRHFVLVGQDTWQCKECGWRNTDDFMTLWEPEAKTPPKRRTPEERLAARPAGPNQFRGQDISPDAAAVIRDMNARLDRNRGLTEEQHALACLIEDACALDQAIQRATTWEERARAVLAWHKSARAFRATLVDLRTCPSAKSQQPNE